MDTGTTAPTLLARFRSQTTVVLLPTHLLNQELESKQVAHSGAGSLQDPCSNSLGTMVEVLPNAVVALDTKPAEGRKFGGEQTFRGSRSTAGPRTLSRG
jgi:hypothetical protein